MPFIIVSCALVSVAVDLSSIRSIPWRAQSGEDDEGVLIQRPQGFGCHGLPSSGEDSLSGKRRQIREARLAPNEQSAEREAARTICRARDVVMPTLLCRRGGLRSDGGELRRPRPACTLVRRLASPFPRSVAAGWRPMRRLSPHAIERTGRSHS